MNTHQRYSYAAPNWTAGRNLHPCFRNQFSAIALASPSFHICHSSQCRRTSRVALCRRSHFSSIQIWGGGKAKCNFGQHLRHQHTPGRSVNDDEFIYKIGQFFSKCCRTVEFSLHNFVILGGRIFIRKRCVAGINFIQKYAQCPKVHWKRIACKWNQ